MPSIFPLKFRTELARQFHRSITNTISSPDLDSLTPVQNTAYTYIATAGQTLFSGLDEYDDSPTTVRELSYTPGRIEVFKNGAKLLTTEYIATTGDEVILNVPATAGDIITILCFDIFTFPNPSDYFYVFLGRPLAWSGSTPTPVDTRSQESETKRNIMAVKRVLPSDVALLISRTDKDWVSGSKYAEYDDDVNLATVDAPLDLKSFYVYNPNNYRLYKCLGNNNQSASTTEPTFSEAGPKKLSDGYTWQLMYEVPTADRIRFLSSSFIPVRFYSTSSTFDHNGSISSINVINGGSGYTSPTVTIIGDGVGASVTANVVSGAIDSFNIVNSGEGYSFALVKITDSGSNAIAEAVLQTTDLPIAVNQNVASYASSTAGAINKIEVTSGGTGYTTSTTVTIVGDGSGATAEITSSDVESGVIQSITLTNRGTGYTFADVELGAPGASAVLKAVIEPQGGHGSNIPQELLSTTVGIVSTIEEIANDFFNGSDFRQIGLIKNIKKFGSDEIFSDNTGNACYIITPTTLSNFNLDNIVTTNTGGKYIVTNKTATSVYLLPVIDSISLDSIMGVSGGASNQTMTSIIEPEISVNSGELVYVNNVDAIERKAGQAEQLKLFIGF